MEQLQYFSIPTARQLSCYGLFGGILHYGCSIQAFFYFGNPEHDQINLHPQRTIQAKCKLANRRPAYTTQHT
jgi:hypothetical protein